MHMHTQGAAKKRSVIITPMAMTEVQRRLIYDNVFNI